jgi:transcriptional regulator with XRE-family HTH domain
MSDFWHEAERKRKLLKISRAEMARRAGISESTVTYGLKRGSKPSGAVRKLVLLVLAAEEKVQQGTPDNDTNASIADLARAADALEEHASQRIRLAKEKAA